MTPYVGFRPYRSAEHGWFFGREQEAQDVATSWQGTGLTVVFGPAKVGKTSLLHAGVLPRIEAESADVLPVAEARREAAAGNPYVASLLAAWAPGRPADMTISEFLDRRVDRFDEYGDPLSVLIAIDQAEELFGGPPKWRREREECLKQLASAVVRHHGLHLLLCVREEFLAAVLPHERLLGQGSRGRLHLRPFGREAALAAVTRPVEASGRVFGPGAAEAVVDASGVLRGSDESGPEFEPGQLQIVCSALWESLPADVREITLEHVPGLVEVDRFLAGFCRQVIGEVAEEQGVSGGTILIWLHEVFVTDHSAGISVSEGYPTTAGIPNAIARALAERHLLRTEQRLGVRWYELQHQRLGLAIRKAENPVTLLGDAEAELAQGNWDLARGLALVAMQAAGREATWVHAQGKAIMGEAAAALGQAEAAHGLLAEAANSFAAMQRFDAVARVLAADGRVWIAQGQPRKAVSVLKSALDWDANSVSVHLALGQALWRAGRVRDALAVLDGVVDLAAQPPPEAVALRAEILDGLGGMKSIA
ncbi:hypothetical protein Acor_33040 [Acrocarpospora corrugata]|uniref:Novel STAND NTPase 1 domain-containing protein n=1 Tax=Acrocarpospora corrugata TaxID=35763 RepID=A0A5M3VZ73_9ACTN|nr:tetratricopeptide repeat protein [Acrocarpospora corrugata]GES01240.1 hypothetical protein Acor_33040 [Acrocarpospora corrugata]